MFAVIISEKGGAERRELFDKGEVTVGRVKENDLILPKGNVSKRHARLLFRDGRFIVADLKSTNGTYVNGRKIAQATLVGEGDKIYVGDFVLRLEAAQASSGAEAEPPLTAPPQAPESTHWDGEFTAKREPPSGDKPPGARSGSREFNSSHHTGPAPLRPINTEPTRQSTRSPLPGGPVTPSRVRHGLSPRALIMGTLLERVAETVDLTPLARGADPEPTLAQRIERSLRERARVLRESGQLPEGGDVDDLVRATLLEVFGLGPIDTLLEDEDVHEIRVFGHERVTAFRNGEAILVDPPFSSEQALLRAIHRLCRRSGQPLEGSELVIERNLPGGMWMHAIVPASSSSSCAGLVLRRRRRAESSLDDLVRAGTMSRPMASFLQHCVANRANILISGAFDHTAPLLGALALAGGPDDRVISLQPVDELWGVEPSPLFLRLQEGVPDAAYVVRAAARLRPDRMIVAPFSGGAAVETLRVIGDGARGVLAAVNAPTLQRGCERLVPDLAAAFPGLTQDVAAAWLVSTFEIAVEVGRQRDGRLRVMRIAELVRAEPGQIALRDIFEFEPSKTGTAEGAEAGFTATGVQPRLLEGLASQPLDPALFRRS